MATRYETCEITWRRTWFWPVYRFVFVAQAIGLKAPTNHGWSLCIIRGEIFQI